MPQELTLIEHLNELRKRLIICLVVLGAATIFSLPFASYGLKVLKAPCAGIIERLAFFSPQEGFLIYMRVAVLCGLIFSMPVFLYQIRAFCLPAVEEGMRRRSGILIVLCFGFFIIGCLFAYFILIPPALKFLINFAKADLEPVISAQRYISFVISLILGCGLVFQMPVLSFALTKLGVLDAAFLRKRYKYAVVVIFIAAAVITPTPDVFNMFILALPMLFLYELSIWVSFFARPKLK